MQMGNQRGSHTNMTGILRDRLAGHVITPDTLQGSIPELRHEYLSEVLLINLSRNSRL